MDTTITLSEQNRQLLQEIKRRTNQMAAIKVVTSMVGQSLDLEKTLATALEIAVEIVDAEASGISMIDHEAQELVLRAQRGWINDFVVTNPMRIPLGMGMSGEVFEKDDVVVYNNLDGTQDYAVPGFRREQFRSIALAPMHARGQIIGILSIMSKKPNSFDDEIVSVLRVVADTVGVALENARLYTESIEQKKRLSAILDATADGIIATDQDGRVRLINNSAARMLSLKSERTVGVPLRELPLPTRIRDALLRPLALDEEEKTFQVTLDNEHVIAVLISAVINDSPMIDIPKQDGWVIVLQDVTHIKQAEIARAQFMQAAAHDMRNPLSVTYSSIITLNKLLTQKDPAVEEIIHLALGGLDRLRTLIDDLLHLEHIESGYGFKLTEFNLLDVLHEVSKESFMLMVDKAITLTLDVQPDIPLIQADVRWFKRALHNYLGNATKYTQRGGAVKLRVFTKNDFLNVEVIDNGPGIPLSAHAHLFERFYRVDGNKAEGSGLGLAIVKSVAIAHGGDVYLRSKPGEGTTFGFTIPLNPPEK